MTDNLEDRVVNDDEPARPANLPPRADPAEIYHPPNQADAAFAERETLVAEAGRLGIPVNPTWPLVILREHVRAAKTAQIDA